MVTRNPAIKASAPKAALAGRVAASWHQDLNAIAMACRASYEGLQAVMLRKTALIEQAVGEWRTVVRVMAEIGPWHSVAHLDKLTVAGLELALADIRELTVLAARSQREAFAIVRQRIHQNIDNAQRLLRA